MITTSDHFPHALRASFVRGYRMRRISQGDPMCATLNANTGGGATYVRATEARLEVFTRSVR
jgi:hypothetical protein